MKDEDKSTVRVDSTCTNNRWAKLAQAQEDRSQWSPLLCLSSFQCCGRTLVQALLLPQAQGKGEKVITFDILHLKPHQARGEWGWLGGGGRRGNILVPTDAPAPKGTKWSQQATGDKAGLCALAIRQHTDRGTVSRSVGSVSTGAVTSSRWGSGCPSWPSRRTAAAPSPMAGESGGGSAD